MTVSSSMTDTTHKSPSKLKRDQLRMTEFNLRKLQETFQNEIKKRTSTIFRLEVEISKLKFELSKQKPKLSESDQPWNPTTRDCFEAKYIPTTAVNISYFQYLWYPILTVQKTTVNSSVPTSMVFRGTIYCLELCVTNCLVWVSSIEKFICVTLVDDDDHSVRAQKVSEKTGSLKV